MRNLNIKIISATISDYPIVQNMARFYVYDISRHCGFISKDQPKRIIFEFNTMDNFIAINDIGVLNIPVVENNELLVDLREQNIIAFGPSPEIPNNTDYTKLRQTVYEKLIEAQNLLPSGVKFCLYEGYRSLDLQKKLFDDRYAKLKSLYPNLSHQELFIETTKMVSPVTNLDGSTNIPPHSTGGAFDIYLIDSDNQIIDMGIKVADWMEDVDGLISKTNSDQISSEAKENRKLMSKTLTEVGFINYPGEYWHWSYGDRYWAYHKNKEAIYGSV